MSKLTNSKRIGSKSRRRPKKIYEEEYEKDDQLDTNFSNNLTKNK